MYLLNLIKRKSSQICHLQRIIDKKLRLKRDIFFSGTNYIMEKDKITGLKLNHCNLTLIDFLANFPDLKYLDLEYNSITDISVIRNLKKLNTLYLSYNKISDISAIENLADMEFLRLSKNEISELPPLINLKKLYLFVISYNKLTNLDSIKELHKLSSLYASDNLIKDISGLQMLKSLKICDLKNNNIEILHQWITEFPLMNINLNKTKINSGVILLYNNPINTPPMDIIKQDKKIIANWFATNHTQKNIYECEDKNTMPGPVIP